MTTYAGLTKEELSNVLSTIFNTSREKAQVAWDLFATNSPFGGAQLNLAWLEEFGDLIEWAGSRVVNDLTVQGYSVSPTNYEKTYGIFRNDLNDAAAVANLNNIVAGMGASVARHPMQLIKALIGAGETANCYDGQKFFDTDHPGTDSAGDPTTQSNLTAGAETGWYLFKLDGPVKPFIFGERTGQEYKLEVHDSGDTSFMTDKVLVGASGRVAATYGLWQYAHKAKVALNATNFEAAYDAMCAIKGANGVEIDCVPTHLVVPQSLRSAAEAIINKPNLGNNGTNLNYGRVELIVIPGL